MRFLADMGVSQRVVTWLQEQGHEATHLRDEGLQKLESGDIFTKAFRESRIILTWDLDFTEILALSKTGTVSAVVFRLMNTRSGSVHMTQDTCGKQVLPASPNSSRHEKSSTKPR